MPKAKKGDANQNSMLKQRNRPKKAQKCAPRNTSHFYLGPTNEEQPSKKKKSWLWGWN
jgi:hypothetical protein